MDGLGELPMTAYGLFTCLPWGLIGTIRLPSPMEKLKADRKEVSHPLNTSPNDPFPIFSSRVNSSSGSALVLPRACRGDA